MARDRRGGTLLVEGPAGAGRSGLLNEALRIAGGCGLSVAYGAADEVRRVLPLAPLTAALGTGSTAPPEEPRQQVRSIELVRARLTQWLTRGPALIALDDLQWADQLTLAALRVLVPRFAGRPLLWVLARRTGEGGPAATRLFQLLAAAEHASRRTLGPLPPQEVARFVGDSVGGTPQPSLLGLAEGADGNPAALVALVEGLLEEGAVWTGRGEAGVRGEAARGQPPRRFAALVEERMTGCRPVTRRLLDVIAVLGRPCSPEEVAHLLACPVAVLLAGFREALDARFLDLGPGGTLRFRHESVRRAVLATVPPPLRAAVHRQAAERILARGGGVSQAAAHLARGAGAGDARTVEVLGVAAAELVVSQPHTAAEYAEQALRLSPRTDPRRVAELAHTAVAALTRAGPLSRAVHTARSALAQPLPSDRAVPLRLGLATALLLAGRPVEAASTAEGVLDDVTAAGPVREEALATWLCALALVDPVVADRNAAALVGTGRRHRAVPVGVLTARAFAHWRTGRVVQAREDARRVRERTAEPSTATAGPPSSTADGPGPGGSGRPGQDPGAALPPSPPLPLPPSRPVAYRLVAAALLGELGDAEEVEAAETLLTAACATTGAPALRGLPLILAGRLALLRGAPAEAEARATRGLELNERSGAALGTPLGWGVLTETALRRGEVTTAQQRLDRLAETAGRFPGGEGHDWRARSHWWAARIAAARLDHTALRNAVRALHTEPTARRALAISEPAATAWLVRCCRDLAEGDWAATFAGTLDDLLTENPGAPSLRAAADHTRGVRQADPEALERAVAGYRDPWLSASAAEDLGTLLGPDDPAAAVRPLDAALECYTRLGAPRDAARVRRRLRRLGVRRRHWTSEDRPATGWDALTGTERAVADLVVHGLTNRQVAARMYLSPHTVGFHLRRIFRKLGVRSRTDLARLHAGSGGPGAHDEDSDGPDPDAADRADHGPGHRPDHGPGHGPGHRPDRGVDDAAPATAFDPASAPAPDRGEAGRDGHVPARWASADPTVATPTTERGPPREPPLGPAPR